MSLYHRFHDRFGTAGVVLGVIAMIIALTGTAIAATGLNGKQKKEVKAIAKSFAGKNGAPGAAGTPGTNGTNGTNGKDGAPGVPGQDGQDGAPGAPGADGKTVLSGNGQPDDQADGTNGDFYIDTSTSEIYGPKTAGTWGAPTDLKGSPWTVGGTLPDTGTLTGVYATPTNSPNIGVDGSMDDGDHATLPVSFSLAVSPAPTFVFVPGPTTYPGADATGKFGSDAPSGCPGVTAAGIPQADPGKFCVYGLSSFPGILVPSATVLTQTPDNAQGSGGMTPAGTVLSVDCSNPDPDVAACISKGLWAVTG